MARPIDTHEGAIVEALSLCDDGAPLSVALVVAGNRHGLAPERLRSLVAMWCALAGVPVPSEAPQ
jgi:hypothetical protein